MKKSIFPEGEIQLSENKIINFVEGPLAFENYKKFVILDAEEENFPFRMLQSMEEESLSFILTDPFLFKEDYDIEISEEILKELEIEKIEEILVYVLLVIPDKVEDISANLLAPIIINVEKKLAKQVIIDNKDYQTKYRIFNNANS